MWLPVSADAMETRIDQLNELTNHTWTDAASTPWWQVLLFSPLTIMLVLIVV